MRSSLLLFRVLNLGHLAAHRFRAVLSLAGIALGVTMVFGILILNGSVTSSYKRSNQALQGVAQLEVTTNGTAGLDEKLVERIRSASGVRVAAPLLIEPTRLEGPATAMQVTAIGFDESLRGLSGILTPDHVVEVRPGPGAIVPQRLLDRLGATTDTGLRVTHLDRATPVSVNGIVAAHLGEKLNGGRFVGLPLPLAQQALDQPERITTILIDAADRSPGAVLTLRQRLIGLVGPGTLVEPLSLRLDQFHNSMGTVQNLSAFVSLVALLVGGYLIFNTMSMAAVERRREAAILLAVGESPVRLIARFVAEAGVLGLAGSLIGFAGGFGLGRFLVQSAPRYLEDAYGFRTSMVVSPVAVIAAVAAGLGVTVLATLLPALAFRRVPPAEAVRPWSPGQVHPNRRVQGAALAAGLGLVVVGLLGARAFPSAAMMFIAILFAGATLAAPALFSGGITLLAKGLLCTQSARWAALTRLAGSNLLRNPGRVVATVSACAFALAMVVAIGGQINTVEGPAHDFADRFKNFDLYVAATDDSYTSVPLPPSAIDAVRAEPGISAVYPSRSTFITWRDRRIYLTGNDPDATRKLNFAFHSGDPAAAVTSMRTDGLLVSTQIAQNTGVTVGDHVTLFMPAGPRTFEVTGVIEELSWPEGSMVIGNQAFSRYLPAQGIGQLLVSVGAGVDPVEVKARLLQRVPNLFVRTGDELATNVAAQQAAQIQPFVQVRNAAVLVLVLSVLNSLFIAVLSRLREIGIQHAIGTTSREIGGTVFLEATAMLVVALVAGAILGVVLHMLGTEFLTETTGLPLRWSLEPRSLLGGALAALLAVVLGSLYPAWLAARVPALEAIRYE
jgi:putative ABC transport system permease protein